MPKYFDLEVSLLEIESRIWRRFLLTGFDHISYDRRKSRPEDSPTFKVSY